MPSKALTPANDNGNAPKIRFEVAELPPVSDIEVEIFNALISNMAALIANDNDAPETEETGP